MMQVLLVLPELEGFSSHVGGIGRRYGSLIPALQENGIELTTIVFSSNGVVAGGQLKGVGVVDLQRVPWPLRRLVVRSTLRRVWSKGMFDCILATEWQGLAVDAPKKAKVVTNLATSLEVAEATTGKTSGSWSARWQRHIERRQIESSYATIAISAAMQKLASSFYRLPDLNLVVRNSIDVQGATRAAATASKSAKGAGDDKTVLFVGRTERRKGIHTAVEAVGLLPKSVHLKIAGADGDPHTEDSVITLVNRLAPGEISRVHHLGPLPPDRLHAQMANADVVICPSLWEGFGNAALEAMCCGTPLIATNGSGFDEFCRSNENSILVPPEDPRALAKAVARVLEDEQFASSLAKAAYATVARFAPDVVVKDFVAALQAAVVGR